MDLTLLILAAGMGSRYGGLKQLDELGPGGETIMDYSVFDAKRAGFTKVVFVIRKDFEAEFRERVGRRYEHVMQIDYVFQQLNDLPGGYEVPQGREKPWGTGQAVYAARHAITTPFVAINADDFYGRTSFALTAEELRKAGRGDFCMCAFELQKTLSEVGSVSRGVCQVDAQGFLTEVVEHTKIVADPAGGALSYLPDDSTCHFTGEEPVSMNMWGFTPDLFEYLDKLFSEFLSKQGGELKSEFYIPSVVSALVEGGVAKVKVLKSPDQWFGVTYREERDLVIAKLQSLADKGEYPVGLFTKD